MRAIVIALMLGLGLIALPSIPVDTRTAYEIAEQDTANEWREFWEDARNEYADEFTALFNSYTYKRSKNGRSMVNGKFVAMPKGN